MACSRSHSTHRSLSFLDPEIRVCFPTVSPFQASFSQTASLQTTRKSWWMVRPEPNLGPTQSEFLPSREELHQAMASANILGERWSFKPSDEHEIDDELDQGGRLSRSLSERPKGSRRRNPDPARVDVALISSIRSKLPNPSAEGQSSSEPSASSSTDSPIHLFVTIHLYLLLEVLFSLPLVLVDPLKAAGLCNHWFPTRCSFFVDGVHSH